MRRDGDYCMSSNASRYESVQIESLSRRRSVSNVRLLCMRNVHYLGLWADVTCQHYVKEFQYIRPFLGQYCHKTCLPYCCEVDDVDTEKRVAETWTQITCVM